MQTDSTHFPATPIALKMAVAIGIGMLAGMEREWSNKDVGIRTFAIVALLGMLASLIGPNVAIAALIGVFLLVAAMNTRSILTDRSLEITTSAALILNDGHCHRNRNCRRRDRPHFPILRIAGAEISVKSKECSSIGYWLKTTTLAEGGHRLRIQPSISLESCHLPL